MGSITTLHIATLRVEVLSSTVWGPTQGHAPQLTNVCAGEIITSVLNLHVQMERGTVMMILNVKAHWFVDT